MTRGRQVHVTSLAKYKIEIKYFLYASQTATSKGQFKTVSSGLFAIHDHRIGLRHTDVICMSVLKLSVSKKPAESEGLSPPP